MLREIFSFERHQFKFDSEVKLVLVILMFYAIFCFALTMHFIKESPIYGWIYFFFAFAAAILPLLPTAFVISVGVSDKRLYHKRIACSNAQNILLAGKVQKALFDKTRFCHAMGQ
jgi:magnesium-transporting ATPase (P-type)